ncbi:MAG: phosphoribosylaminoimidazolesuccinocarboxamide synthase [Candidatus Wallbacteria bacterium]|nr:phosphoribosylaminoimidazolesuccinocarboxamide synthase [Candidatus Wallbacteria bacterium]
MKAFNDTIQGMKLLKRGKVRDIYEIDSDRLMIVTTDRISAFDRILPVLIPGKGEILNGLSLFWFDLLASVVPNHYLGGVELTDMNPNAKKILSRRAMVVRKASVLPVECVVRGYLAGSGFMEYRENGSICGLALPVGLQEASRLPEPLFTPTTKAEHGHDLAIDFSTLEKEIGKDRAARIRKISLDLYCKAADEAARCGIIIADTKFEFGLLGSDILLVDEVLTPDSSRFWPAATYRPGCSPESYDKQYIRDYLKHSGSEGDIPDDVIEKTVEKYQEIFTRLTGRETAENN